MENTKTQNNLEQLNQSNPFLI